MGFVTVSAKVRRELWEKLRGYGVNISEVIRRALEEEIKKREEKEAKKLLNEASKLLRKLSEEEIVKSVRESREER
ncbi:MAG: type II toxin-antitoxin system CcdA family antitoxin [Thermoprotei archaeon]